MSLYCLRKYRWHEEVGNADFIPAEYVVTAIFIQVAGPAATNIPMAHMQIL